MKTTAVRMPHRVNVRQFADCDAQRLAQLLDDWARVRSTTHGHAATLLAHAISKLAFRPQQSGAFRQAHAWCWNDDRRAPLAFRNQCAALHIDPRRLRRQLRNLLRERASRMRSRPARRSGRRMLREGTHDDGAGTRRSPRAAGVCGS